MPTATLRAIHLSRAQGPDRVVVVSLQASWTHADSAMLAVARGAGRHKLIDTRLYGPLPLEAAHARFDEIVESLRAEGFGAPGRTTLLQALDSPHAKARALAAVRLGWLREPSAVGPLLAAAARGGEELSTIVDALGAIGDPKAIPLAREEAARKLLSRRRSGIEALRRLGDEEGLAQARARTLDRLPESLRLVLGSLDASDLREASVTALVEALAAVVPKDRGLALDTLYELASPLATAAVGRALGSTAIERPQMWRYVKSVFKRALLRHDARTFGLLAHRIERSARSASPTRATLKSGYDGASRETPVFGRRTTNYLRRLAWRYLRRLATYRPEAYVSSAAWAVAPYEPADEQRPRRDYGAYASCYLLHHILWGESGRYELRHGSLRFRLRPGAPAQPPAGVREEAYPHLWDAEPSGWLHLLGTSALVVVHEIALRSILDRHPEVVKKAPHDLIVALLGAPFGPTVELGLTELGRRFDGARPDFDLIELVLAHPREDARRLALTWLTATAALWTTDAERCCRILTVAPPEARDTIVGLCERALLEASATVRRSVAERVLAVLGSGEPEAGAHEALGAVARTCLLTELAGLTDVGALLGALQHGSTPMKTVAAAVLARRDDALEHIDLPTVATLARHELVLVRQAALSLLERALPRMGTDPSLLLAVAESEWPDSRAGATSLLRRMDPRSLEPGAVLELLDSSRAEVQALGRELLTAHRERFAPVEVLSRLLEHPDPRMRPFVLDEIATWLEGDLGRLSAPFDFLRKVLLDLSPSRRAKGRAIALLERSGERSESSARLAAAVLSDLLRIQCHRDFDEALAALVRIRLAFPEVETPVTLEAVR